MLELEKDLLYRDAQTAFGWKQLIFSTDSIHPKDLAKLACGNHSRPSAFQISKQMDDPMPREIFVPQEIWDAVRDAKTHDEYVAADRAFRIIAAGGEKEFEREELTSTVISSMDGEADRAVGLLWGALLEERIEATIKRFLRPDAAVKKVEKKFFETMGPLGTFSAKVDLAALLGIYGFECWKTIQTIKKIRNEFAHKLEASSFEKDPIRSHCANLVMIDRFISTEEEGMIKIKFEGGAFGFHPNEHPLRTARLRFIHSCGFIFNALGNLEQGDRNPTLHGELPSC